MKKQIISSWMILMLMSVSSTAYAHIDGQHATDLRERLMHLFVEPSHLTLLMFIIFILALALRHQVLRITERYLEHKANG